MPAALASEAWWFLPPVTLIALWVAFNDMKYMKIPNKAVLALLGLFVVLGLIALPLEVYAWRAVQIAIVLAVGFVLTVLGLIGAGDAKFAAAMAGFIALADLQLFGAVFAACILAGFATHRLARALPIVRRAVPDWASWTSAKFPMGLALGAALVIHLGLIALR